MSSVLTLEAKLERTDSATTWGFRMQGGKDFSSPLSIQRVDHGSLAAKCGLLMGDIILKIGNQVTEVLKHKDAKEFIIRSGNKLDLLIQRGAAGQPASGGYDRFNGPQINTNWNSSQSAPSPVSAPSPAGSGHQNFNQAPRPFGGQAAPAGPSYQNNLVHQTQQMTISSGGAHHPHPAPPPVQSYKPQPSQGPSFQAMQPGTVSAAPPSKAFNPAPAPVANNSPRPFGAGAAAPKPSGKGAKRGNKGDAAISQALPASGRIPVCHNCALPIRGPFVTALGNCWCPDHFVCANPGCGTKLLDIGFVEEGGHLYCERDYAQHFAPQCDKCGRAVIGECVNALDKSYHPECFLCAACNGTIGGSKFHMEDGKFYCEKDWATMFQTMCAGCEFPIEPGDRWVEAMGKNFHSECFNCQTCQVNLEGQQFCAKGAKPYCKKHAR